MNNRFLWLFGLLLLANVGWAATSAETEGHQPMPIPKGATSATPQKTELPQGKDYLSWDLLAKVTILQPKTKAPAKKRSNLAIVVPDGWDMPKPQFPDIIKKLHGTEVKLAGFMFPLDPSGDKQKRFILSRTPPSCAFCLPGGPESMVMVEAVKAVRYTLEPVVVTGHFVTLLDDKDGMFYKITKAKP